MNGYQLTFYTEQNRKHGHQTVCEWLLHEVRQLGIMAPPSSAAPKASVMRVRIMRRMC